MELSDWTFSAFKMDKEDKDTNLKFIQSSDKSKDIIYVFTPNDVEIGHIFMAEEGDYEFWPILRGGYWPSWGMRQIADYLDVLNIINMKKGEQ